MSKGLLFEEDLFVLLVVDVLLHGVLFQTLGLLDALSTGLKDVVHLGAQSDIFEQQVRICVQKLAALSILRLHLVVVKVVHEMEKSKTHRPLLQAG